MSRALVILYLIAIVCLALASLGGLTWANTLYTRAHPGETDFLVPWLGMRTFLQYGDNPYDEPATQRAQLLHYGRLAKEGEDPLWLDVPFPAELFYFPFALVTDYALARGLWMTLLEVALAFTALLSLAITSWKPGRALLAVFVLFGALWLHAWLPLLSGSTAVLTTLCMVGGLLALRTERDEMAGALLLLSAFQPLANGVFTLFVLWWVLYHRRWRVLWGALMLLGLMLVAAFIFLPSWFLPSLRALLAEYRYGPLFTPGTVFAGWWPAIGEKLGGVLTAILAIVLFLEWRAARGKDYRHFLWTACLTLAITPLVGVPAHPGLYAALILPLTLYLSIVAERWTRQRRWNLAGILLVLIFAGSWAVVYGLAALASFAPLRFVLIFALPSFLLIGLYWVRWWAIRPPRTEFETLKKEIT
jgi:hypothetical protein